MHSSHDFGSHTCLALARHMDELQARAKLANVHVSDDSEPGVEQSALKARDLGVAFAHPDSPSDQRPTSGMTLMSNSPDAFKGREIRVSHAAGVRFDDRTTNREEFPAHPVSPTNYGNGVRKAYAPSPVKFEGKTTAQEEYPAHVIVAKRPPVGLWVENDRTEILIHGGRELPARVSRVFSTTEHGQTAVAVRIVQGWSRKASENARLGVFEMTGIAPGPPGKAQIKVTFDLDENGVLTVTGEDKESGQTQQAQTQTMDK